MHEINYKQHTAQLGKLNGIIRIDGKILYLKSNSSQQADQMIANFQSKGALIEKSKHNTWIKVDMFHNQTIVKLGEDAFDIRDKTDEDIEKLLYKFYMIQFTKANFECVGKEIDVKI